LFSCSKERIETSKNSYQSMNDYLDSKKQEEQTFIITEEGECPITGKEGTKICGSKTVLTPSVDWPYTVKLVELLNPKEMIYYQHSNVNSNGFLTNDGEIRVLAEKDGTSLTINSNSTWQVEFPNSSPLTEMKVFQGSSSSDQVTWNTTSSGNYTTSSYGYLGYFNAFGWVSVAKQANTPSATITISLTSETDELENVITYIYLTDYKSLTQAQNQSATGIPSGVQFTVIMMATDSNGDFYTYTSNQTLSVDTSIDVTLSKVSEADMTAMLDKL